MSGLGGGNRDAHGFRVAHFADHDDVGGLPQRCPERGRKIRSVDANLNLLNYASDMLMLILDRILDGYDVTGLPAVDLIDQSGERSGLS